MATFAPAAHPPILCEHNHGVINESNGEAIEEVCGRESFETDDGLPSFEDCLVTNTGGGTSTVRTDLICILLHQYTYVQKYRSIFCTLMNDQVL